MTLHTMFLAVVSCLLMGIVVAFFWPRRHTPEARTFVMAAVVTATVLAVVNIARKSGRLR